MAPSGERLRRKSRHGVFADKTVWSMPEHFEIHTVYKMVLYKYSSFPFSFTIHPPSSRLPLLSARPAVTFPAAKHHRPLAGTKLYCLVTEAHRCEQLAQGCYAAFYPKQDLSPWPVDHKSNALPAAPLHQPSCQYGNTFKASGSFLGSFSFLPCCAHASHIHITLCTVYAMICCMSVTSQMDEWI